MTLSFELLCPYYVTTSMWLLLSFESINECNKNFKKEEDWSVFSQLKFHFSFAEKCKQNTFFLCTISLYRTLSHVTWSWVQLYYFDFCNKSVIWISWLCSLCYSDLYHNHKSVFEFLDFVPMYNWIDILKSFNLLQLQFDVTSQRIVPWKMETIVTKI